MLRPTAQDPTHPAFTLVEVIVVIVMLGVLSICAVPALNSLAASRSGAAARLVLSDLNYARERAMQTGARSWVTFNPAANTVSILAENPASPGRAGAAILKDPGGADTFTDTLGSGPFAGVSILSASFDGNTDVGFDALGRPLNHNESPLASDGRITLSGPATITIKSNTGFPTIP